MKIAERFLLLMSPACLLLSGCGLASNDIRNGPGQNTTLTLSLSSSDLAVGDTGMLNLSVQPSASNSSVELLDESTEYRGLLTFSGASTQVPIITVTGGPSYPQSVWASVGSHVYTAVFDQVGDLNSSSAGPIRFTVHAAGAQCGLGSAAIVPGSALPPAGASIQAPAPDANAVCASNGQSLTLDSPVITGGSSTLIANDSGTGAGVLAYNPSKTSSSGGTVTLNGGSVDNEHSSTGAVMATGLGSKVVLNQTSVSAISGTYGNAVANYTVAALRAGSVQVVGGSIASGQNVYNGAGPALWIGDGGSIQLSSGASVTDFGNLVEIDGVGTLSAEGSTFTSTGYLCFFSAPSEDGASGVGSLSLSNTAVTYTGSTQGALFWMGDGSTAVISLHASPVTATSGLSSLPLLGYARAASGGNGGADVTVQMDQETLNGSFPGGSHGKLNLALTNSTQWTGTTGVNGGAVSVSMDAGSSWIVTADSNLTVLSNPSIGSTDIPNIYGNGHTITYIASENPTLAGRSFNLAGGGTLKPSN